jgi:hypothetical protein
MSSISMISPMVDTVVYQDNSVSKHKHRLGTQRSIPTKKANREEFIWTNFHCLLCLGIGGFLVFWTMLLLR